jgi:hypothetical protein
MGATIPTIKCTIAVKLSQHEWLLSVHASIGEAALAPSKTL